MGSNYWYERGAKKEAPLVDIKDDLEDERTILDGIRERLKDHRAQLLIERERYEVLDKYHAVLKGEFGRLSSGRPHHVTLSSLLPFRLRIAPILGWVTERIRIDVAVPARLALIALSIERKHAKKTCEYLEFAIKDETLREANQAKLVGETRDAHPSP